MTGCITESWIVDVSYTKRMNNVFSFFCILSRHRFMRDKNCGFRRPCSFFCISNFLDLRKTATMHFPRYEFHKFQDSFFDLKLSNVVNLWCENFNSWILFLRSRCFITWYDFIWQNITFWTYLQIFDYLLFLAKIQRWIENEN